LLLLTGLTVKLVEIKYFNFQVQIHCLISSSNKLI